MKTPILILSLLIGLGMASCIQDEDLATPGSSDNNSNDVINSSWQITYFWDSDHEETYHFSGFTFSFESDGIIVATDGNNRYTGTWSDGNDDNTAKLIINFSNPSDFEELSDDWHVLEWTDTRIRLEDISGGNGGTDILTFEKI